MLTLLFTVMVIFGILFIVSVLLMAPKGGLGFGVGGMSTSNEYGSKKSIEWTLKKTAVISIIFFTIAAILYPYANRKINKITTSPIKIQTIKTNTKLDSKWNITAPNPSNKANDAVNKKLPSALVAPKTDKNK